MKSTLRLRAASALAVVLLGAGLISDSKAAAGPRTDINPALIYHQAILALPSFSEAEQDHFQTNDWRGREFDAAAKDILGRYGSAYRLLSDAARQTAPCDWGLDLSQGPGLLLPQLAKAKSIALTTRKRVRWHLEEGRPQEAAEDWVSTLVFARQISRGGVLVSALVQFAMEHILGTTLAENWHRLDAPTLNALLAGMDRAPARGSIRDCLATERIGFRDWFVGELEKARASGADESAVLKRARELFRDLEPEPGDMADRALAAAGGTSAGLIQGLKALDPMYDEIARVIGLPVAEMVPEMKTLQARIDAPTNALTGLFFSSLPRCRVRELRVEAQFAMIRAAAGFRTGGEVGLRRVTDPLSGEPFEMRRFVFEGVDRGFELRSKVLIQEFPEVLIFLEKTGPPFQLSGPFSGKGTQ